jgi:hypothetical protein
LVAEFVRIEHVLRVARPLLRDSKLTFYNFSYMLSSANFGNVAEFVVLEDEQDQVA